MYGNKIPGLPRIQAPMRKQGDNAASIPKRPTSSPGLHPIQAPMRKQGDNAASIPKRPTSSPGLRLGAFMGRIHPRLMP